MALAPLDPQRLAEFLTQFSAGCRDALGYTAYLADQAAAELRATLASEPADRWPLDHPALVCACRALRIRRTAKNLSAYLAGSSSATS